MEKKKKRDYPKFLEMMSTEFIDREFQFNAKMAESSHEISKLYEELLSIRKMREKQLFNEINEVQHEIEKYTERIKDRKHQINECMMRKAHCEIILNERKS
jgi:DNA-binding protein H-NS